MRSVRTYAYDALSRPLTATDPLGHTVTATYDANGNRTLAGKADGVTNRYVYDTANRLTGIDLQNNQSIDVSFGYDAASRRTSMADGTGTTTYVYNNADRRTSMTAPVTGTVGYGYDAAGRLTTLTYPSSHQVSYGYDDRGRLASVTDWGGRTTTYTYDAANRLTTTAYPNTVTTSRSYDNADRLLSITHAKPGTTLESLSYVYDDASNRTSLTDSTGTTSFTYDALDRLTQAVYPNSGYTNYGYDAVGNRSSSTTNGVTTTNTFDVANRMTASGATSFGYDANGNQTSQSVGGVTTTYTYDALDRLTALSGPSSATYLYNGDGLRVRKTVGGTTTNDAWAGLFGTPQVIADGTNEYVWSVEFISQVTLSTGTASYPLGDALDSTRQLVDGTGTAIGTAQYDAFGGVRAQSGTQARFGFAAGQTDAESGLLYLRARYYNPSTGRFLSRDPLPGSAAVPASQHAYVYVQNNPTRWTDPSGRDRCEDDDAAARSAVCEVPHGPPAHDPRKAAECVRMPLACTDIPQSDIDAYNQCVAMGGGNACFDMSQDDLNRLANCISDPQCADVLDFLVNQGHPTPRNIVARLLCGAGVVAFGAGLVLPTGPPSVAAGAIATFVAGVGYVGLEVCTHP